jgi:4-aminobutyrate aminotransferase-like enzyme
MQNLAAELEREQAYVDVLYRRLDTLRERTQAELERALGSDGGGNVLRIAPPLILTEAEADEGLEILAHALAVLD